METLERNTTAVVDDDWLRVDGPDLGITNSNGIPLHIEIFQPIAPYMLHITDEFQYNVFNKRPNWWWRFWQWLLLGWRWGEINSA